MAAFGFTDLSADRARDYAGDDQVQGLKGPYYAEDRLVLGLDNDDWLKIWARHFGESAVVALAEELRRLPWNARRN
jgi:hypothetical protein